MRYPSHVAFAAAFAYEVAADGAAAFEAVYGPEGEWARYFHGADGYRGTELLRATGRGGLSYLVIDRWESAAGVRALPRRARGGVRAAQPGRRAPVPAGDGPRPLRRDLVDAATQAPPSFGGLDDQRPTMIVGRGSPPCRPPIPKARRQRRTPTQTASDAAELDDVGIATTRGASGGVVTGCVPDHEVSSRRALAARSAPT